jgi:hypothetical protein
MFIWHTITSCTTYINCQIFSWHLNGELRFDNYQTKFLTIFTDQKANDTCPEPYQWQVTLGPKHFAVYVKQFHFKPATTFGSLTNIFTAKSSSHIPCSFKQLAARHTEPFKALYVNAKITGSTFSL